MKKRLNKNKKEISQDIKLIQKTNHLRTVVKEKIYPILLELNDTIGFTKIFLQNAALSLETESNKQTSQLKVSTFIPVLNKIFTSKDNKTEEHYKYYRKLFLAMKDETVQDFVSLIEMTPRHIERFFTQEIDKKPIIELPIERILG